MAWVRDKPPTMTNLNQVGDTIDCRELATRYFGQPAQKAGRAWQWYCPFHTDHKTPSFTAYPDGYHCFGCGTHGRPVDLVIAMDFLDYHSAVRHLLDMTTAAPAWRQPRPAPGQRRQAGVEAWREAGWQASTWRLVDQAAACLAGPRGGPGRAYLQARGLEPATWQAWQLGYVPEVRRCRQEAGEKRVELLGPAITLPWTNGRCVKAVQYRLLSHPTRRYWQKAGGDRTLFGVQCVRGQRGGEARRPALVLVEGELNAISIWQAAGEGLDVVSFGPQSNIDHVGGLMRRLAARYELVVVWADQMAAALNAQATLGRCAAAVCSPGGRDANDLLVAGQLDGFLHEALAGAAGGEGSHDQRLH